MKLPIFSTPWQKPKQDGQFEENIRAVDFQINKMVPALVPTGGVLMWTTSIAPDGFLLCDGSSYLRSNYRQLFNVVGTRFGAVDALHFNVPDVRGRVAIGTGQQSGGTLFGIGGTGGEETHLLTGNESGIQNHQHTVDTGILGTGGGNFAAGTFQKNQGGGWSSTTSAVSANAVSAHNNLQPYVVLTYIIKW